jgi:hypothetical protein
VRTTHTIRADYPLAGSEDGLPVEIRFTYLPGRAATRYASNGDPGDPGWSAEIEFEAARPVSTWAEPLPSPIASAIEAWARDWIEDDDGFDRALVKALDDIEADRERAAEYRREA